jgi:protein-tyrosine-phosphatase
VIAAIASGLMLLGMPNAPPARQPADTQRVVFVCEHGTVKSVVAAALFNKLARKRGLAAVAVSRGTAPDSALPALVRDGLLADGAGPWRARPTRLTSADVPGASLFVSFDQPVEALVGERAPLRHWDGTPSVMQTYATGRDAILERVRALVAEMERGQGRGAAKPR